MGLLSVFGVKPAVRVPLRGGGSVAIPAPFAYFPPGDYRHRDAEAVTAYRRWHSTLAGTNECDGMIAAGRPQLFADLAEFVSAGRGALTTRWAYANESEGRWYGRPETFAETETDGPNGRERAGRLSVHLVGFWKPYDAPGALYAANDRRGVMVAVWIFDKHGGEKRARRYAERIAASFRPD